MIDQKSILILRIWLGVAALALSLHLGSYPLFDADEGRNGEVGREMAATNDYVMPRYDGMPYLDKPIVYFAAEAVAMEALGPTELAARLPAYLFTLLTAIVLFLFARRVWGEGEGLISAIAYLSMPLTLAFSRTVIFDSALSFFIVVAIVSFYFAIEERFAEKASGAGSRFFSPSARWNSLGWSAIALGVLTKGPVAIAVPMLIAIPYAIRRKSFKALGSIPAFLLFIVIIAPWVWAISLKVPDFLHYVLVTETVQRLATKALKRTGPPWYFIPYLIGGALPWSIVAIPAVRREKSDLMLYLVLWVAVPFLFFSISQSKRPQYILPLLPAVALLAGRFLARHEGIKAIRVAAAILLALSVPLLAAPFLHLKMDPEVASGIEASAIPMGLATLIGAAAALVFVRRRAIAVVALTLPIIAIPMTANPLMEAIGARRSSKDLVAQLQSRISAGTPVVGIEAFTGSMAFYLRRTIVVVTPDAEELTSNYIVRHYDQFAGDAESRVRRVADLKLRRDAIYIVRKNDSARARLLEAAGFVAVARDVHNVAYAANTMAAGQSSKP